LTVQEGVIRSFASRDTERLFNGYRPRGLPTEILSRSLRRLERINAAARVDDLRSPPSHRLEVLKGDRAGQWSIRINDQWRICFRFEAGDAFDVEIVDYHRG
jgi:proteic killer suppression protein